MAEEKKGGLLDNLINKGSLPSVEVELSTETLIHLGVTIILAATIIILVQTAVKTALK